MPKAVGGDHKHSANACLTDQEVNQLLADGQKQFDEIEAELQAKRLSLTEDIAEHRDTLGVALGAPVEAGTPEARTAKEETAYARLNWQALISPIRTWLKFWVGVACVCGFFGTVGIEWSMFSEVFSTQFENEFGEIAAADRWLIGLYAFQAVIAMLAIKFWAAKARRTEWLTAAAFVGAVLFVSGAVIKHADAQIRASSLAMGADVGLGWTSADSGVTADTYGDLPLQVGSALSALGFLVVPIVGALLLGFGWSQISDALKDRVHAQRTRITYRKYRAAEKELAGIDRKMKAHHKRRDAIVTAPLNTHVGEALANAREVKRRVSENRLSGLNGIVEPGSPDGFKGSFADPAQADAMADDTLEYLGNGFVKHAYDAWTGTKNGAPP